VHVCGRITADSWVVRGMPTSKLLLPGCVPAVEAQLAAICGEVQRVHLHADRGCKVEVHQESAYSADSQAERWTTAALHPLADASCQAASASVQSTHMLRATSRVAPCNAVRAAGTHAHTSSRTRPSSAASQRWFCLQKSQHGHIQKPECKHMVSVDNQCLVRLSARPRNTRPHS
jgi:hypothetical protein